MAEEAPGLFCGVSEADAPHGSTLGGGDALGAAVPGAQFRHFILDGLLYTVVFAGVIVLFYRGSEEYDTLKQRGLKLLKRKKECT